MTLNRKLMQEMAEEHNRICAKIVAKYGEPVRSVRIMSIKGIILELAFLVFLIALIAFGRIFYIHFDPTPSQAAAVTIIIVAACLSIRVSIWPYRPSKKYFICSNHNFANLTKRLGKSKKLLEIYQEEEPWREAISSMRNMVEAVGGELHEYMGIHQSLADFNGEEHHYCLIKWGSLLDTPFDHVVQRSIYRIAYTAKGRMILADQIMIRRLMMDESKQLELLKEYQKRN